MDDIIWNGHTTVYYFSDEEAAEIDPETLSRLVLPEDLKRIEDNAFDGTNIQAVIIPDGCSYIGSKAFGNCKNLVYVTYARDTVIEDNAFEGCDSLSVRLERE